MYPFRMKDIDPTKQKTKLKNWEKSLSKSWRLCEDHEDGDHVLTHFVQPSRRTDSTGQRKCTYGWKIVPPTKFYNHITAQVRRETLSRIFSHDPPVGVVRYAHMTPRRHASLASYFDTMKHCCLVLRYAAKT